MLCIDWDIDSQRLIFRNEGPTPPAVVSFPPLTTVAAAAAGGRAYTVQATANVRKATTEN
jgi:hypothetical protein